MKKITLYVSGNIKNHVGQWFKAKCNDIFQVFGYTRNDYVTGFTFNRKDVKFDRKAWTYRIAKDAAVSKELWELKKNVWEKVL